MRRPRHNAFTLLELLISIAIIALVASILVPALGAGRHAANDLECRANLRTVCMDFTNFADAGGAATRGDSVQYGDNRFRIEDFQESVYRIDEFWDGVEAERLAIDASEQPLVCPAQMGRLERRRGIPCSSGAIGPQQNVSIGFNKRLDTRTRVIDGSPFPARAYLADKILHEPDVPLLFDVDGEAALALDKAPYYSAPPILDDDVEDVYEAGNWWFPSYRHRGRLNVGFVGGHVLSSSHPLTEPWWLWAYEPGA